MIDPRQIELEDIAEKNPERIKWEGCWHDFRLAYRGGEEFKIAAGHYARFYRSGDATQPLTSILDASGARRPRRFLWQHEAEPDVVYNQRWFQSEYVNYIGAIVDYFTQYLFSIPPIIRPIEGTDEPDWALQFRRNCTGNGESLEDFVKRLFPDVLQCRYAGWMVGRQETVGEQEEGDEGPILTPFQAEEIVDWQLSESGETEWIVLRKEHLEREFPGKRVKVETFTYLSTEQWATWEVRHDGDRPEDARLEFIDGKEHDYGCVPWVWYQVPHGLWLLNRIFSPAMGLYNRWNGLKRAQHIACFIQPYLKTRETGEGKGRHIWGSDYILELRAGTQGQDGEEAGWLSPDIAPLEHLSKQLREDKDELYRIVHQMSLAVDSQAVGAVARSGASKVEDRRAVEVILTGYGAVPRRAVIDTFNLLSRINGDDTEWSCDGYDSFNISEPLEEIQFLALGSTFGIDSPTFKKATHKKAARLVLEGEDDTTLDAIEDEIEESVALAQEQADMKAESDSAIAEANVTAAQVAAKEGMKPGVKGQEQVPMPPTVTGKPPVPPKKPYTTEKPA